MYFELLKNLLSIFIQGYIDYVFIFICCFDVGWVF